MLEVKGSAQHQTHGTFWLLSVMMLPGSKRPAASASRFPAEVMRGHPWDVSAFMLVAPIILRYPLETLLTKE